jgi:serine/threonine-protein kinase
MSSSDDLRGRADALFDRAFDLDPGEQAAFLSAACPGEPDLRAEVEELLRLAADTSGALEPEALKESPLWQELNVEPEARSPEVPAGRIGRWRVLGELGRGGMGVVYLVERADGEFEQRAALKLLHPSLASAEALRRVEQERQILAGLEHPGIARLLDGGRADDGRPYLVMERVEGRPIDRYCDEERLTVAARLRLFVAVGRAVEHAHRSLVVHRDIKPSNIVVTDSGEVKLLDFGIAKLLQPEAAAEPLTGTITRILTPDYASPEQVLGGAITVASDVYQLGLLLYELLTGRRPYRVGSVSALEIERAVCHLEPRRPSAIVGAPAPAPGPEERAADEIAARRRTTPRALARRLRGDLDTIVLQALRKEPERRYASVAHLVEDVERHLAALPVRARGDSFGYRAARLALRHRATVASALLGVLLLVGWAVTATRQAAAIGRQRDRAQAEAAKARQVKELVVRLFEGVQPAEARGRELSARELLDRGWASLEDELAGQPEVQAELLETVGGAYRELGVYDRARRLLDRALELARAQEGADPRRLPAALLGHGRLRRDLGEYDAAEAELREALELRRALGPVDPEVATILSDLAMTVHHRGDYRQGEELFRQALAMRRELFGDAHPEVAESLDELGTSLRHQARYAEAELLLREALELRRRVLPERHPQLATSLSNLALVVQNLGRLEEAEALLREALEIVVAVRGEGHLYTAVTMNNLARLLRARGDLDAAEPLLRQALVVRRQTLGEAHPQVAMNLNDLGRLLEDRGDLDGAEVLYREALLVYPADHPWRSATGFNLGRLREALEDYAGAERLYRESIADQRLHYGSDHERVGVGLNRLGVVLHRQGDLAGAEAALREALEVFRKRLPENHTRLAEALVPLGEVLIAGGAAGEAEPLLREGLAILEAGFGDRDPRTVAAAAALRRALAIRR